MPFPSTLARSAFVVSVNSRAHLILMRSTASLLLVRRVHVQSSFNFFHEVVSGEKDSKAGSNDKNDATEDDKAATPTAKAQNKPSEFEIVLKYVNDRAQSRPPSEGGPLSEDETKTLVRLADKYGGKALFDAINVAHVKAAIAANPPNLFGFAMSHGLTDTARDALALFQKKYTVESKASPYSLKDECCLPIPPTEQGTMSGGRPFVLTDVPAADLARIPFKVSLDLQAAQERVLLDGAKWKDEAKKIKLNRGQHRSK